MFVKRIDKNSLVIGTPAKINLFLEVLSRREDGFHNINSLFQAISIFDRLRFERTTTSGIDLSIRNNDKLQPDEDNLVMRACRLMWEEHELPGGLSIELEKNIPIGAGLGGGSSDCAATIIAINMLHNLRLNRARMTELGARLGSDVSFFFGSGQASVIGRGEQIVDVRLPTDYWLVLVSPGDSVATTEAYARLKMGLTSSRKATNFSGCRELEDFLEFLDTCGNDFQDSHLQLYPTHSDILDRLLQSGARIARMSGSGSTFFGVFVECPKVDTEKLFDGSGWRTDVARPITMPPMDIVEAGGARGDHRD
jgi:4-diphosphocytidyl-2-C-methyl-D-erythritol kinase